MIGMFSEKADETDSLEKKKTKDTKKEKITSKNFQPPGEKSHPPKVSILSKNQLSPKRNVAQYYLPEVEPTKPDTHLIKSPNQVFSQERCDNTKSGEMVNVRKRPFSSSSNDSAVSDYSAPFFTREYHKNYFKLTKSPDNSLEKEPGSVESKLALQRYPDINKCLSEIKGFQPKKFEKVDSFKSSDDQELLNVEDNDLDPIQIFYTGDLHCSKSIRYPASVNSADNQRLTVKTDPILKKFGRKTVYEKTRLEGCEDHYQKLNEIEVLKRDFVNSLTKVPHDILSSLDKYSSQDIQEMTYKDRMDYFLHALVCKFNSYISFIMKGERILLLAPDTRNTLMRRNAFLNALLIFGIRYEAQDDTVTLPNMVKVPISHYIDLFKNPTQVKGTMEFIKLWKRLFQNDYTILALVTVMAFFDAGAPNLTDREKKYCKDMFQYYSKLLERYCLTKLMPVAYIDVIFNFSSISAKRSHSTAFIQKQLSCDLRDSRLFAELNDCWLRHVGL